MALGLVLSDDLVVRAASGSGAGAGAISETSPITLALKWLQGRGPAGALAVGVLLALAWVLSQAGNLEKVAGWFGLKRKQPPASEVDAASSAPPGVNQSATAGRDVFQAGGDQNFHLPPPPDPDLDSSEKDIGDKISGHTYPLPASSLDPLADYIDKRLRLATAGFFVPNPAWRDEPAEVTLKLRSASVSPEDLRIELEKESARLGVIITETVKAGPSMRAVLVADKKVDIKDKDPPVQAFIPEHCVSWRWIITPRQRGNITLTVTLTYEVQFESVGQAFPVRTWDKSVVVQVNAVGRARDLLKLMKDYWPLLVGLASGIAILLGWWMGR